MHTLLPPTRPKPKLRGVVHLLSAVAAVPATYWLFERARPGAASTVAVVYGVCLIVLFAVSAFYHTPMWQPATRRKLRRLDRSAIFVFIAGSYMPFFTLLEHEHGYLVAPLVWAGAGLGIVKTLFFPNTSRFFTAFPYVALGWIPVFFVPALYAQHGGVVLSLILGGGLIYTVGALIYARRWPDPAPTYFGYHEIFHTMVTVAAGCHYIGAWRVLGPA
jgi:hemolysin III